MKNTLTMATIVGLLASCSTLKNPIHIPQSTSGFSFYVIGDSPYTQLDEDMLRKAMPIVKSSQAPFIIHIGDYKGGGTECTVNYDQQHDDLMSELSPKPVFYTPGDNEWTDCERNTDPATGKKYSELDRLDTLRETKFKSLPLGSAKFDAKRQTSQIENIMWRYNNVRFTTLHVVGTNNGRDQINGDPLPNAKRATDNRDRRNAHWLNNVFRQARAEKASAVIIALHGDITNVDDKPEDIMCTHVSASRNHSCDAFTDLRQSIRAHAIQYKSPVLVIHGDTAPFTLDQKFTGEEAHNLWRLNAAGDAGPGYGVSDITEVRITFDEALPFVAQGVTTGKLPKPS